MTGRDTTTADQATSWAIAETFSAYLCPRGCGELIYPCQFPDEPDSMWEVPYGSNRTHRHTRERCDKGRKHRMLARVYPWGQSDQALWDWSLRFQLDAKDTDPEIKAPPWWALLERVEAGA